MKESPLSDPRRDISREDWYVELQRLAQRHELGELSDDEFAQEKRRILKKSRRRNARPDRFEVLAVTYLSEFDARSAFDQLRQLNQDVGAGVVDAAVLTKEISGEVQVLEYEQLATRKGGGRVAGIGAIVPVIFPASLVVGAESGFDLGALVKRLGEEEIDDLELRALGDSVKPGDWAIIVVAHAQSASELVGRLRGYNMCTMHALPAEIASAVLIELEGHGDPSEG